MLSVKPSCAPSTTLSFPAFSTPRFSNPRVSNKTAVSAPSANTAVMPPSTPSQILPNSASAWAWATFSTWVIRYFPRPSSGMGAPARCTARTIKSSTWEERTMPSINTAQTRLPWHWISRNCIS